MSGPILEGFPPSPPADALFPLSCGCIRLGFAADARPFQIWCVTCKVWAPLVLSAL
jgi:hypothetical protein